MMKVIKIGFRVDKTLALTDLTFMFNNSSAWEDVPENIVVLRKGSAITHIEFMTHKVAKDV